MPKVAARPFHRLTFAKQVAAARSTARAIVFQSIAAQADDTPLVEHLATLTADEDLRHGVPGASAKEFGQLDRRLRAAMALGVAIGMLLNHAAVDGGAR